MTTRRFGLTVVLTSVLAASALALPAPAAAQSSACNLAQASATAAIDVSMKRLEDARLTNRPASLREATLAVQASLVYIRALLAPCAEVQAAGEEGHAGHVMPPATASPAVSIGAEPTSAVAPAPTPAAADAHAGHVMPAAAPPAAPEAAAAQPAAASDAAANAAASIAPAPKAAASSAPAPATPDAHAGHVMPPAPSSAGRPAPPASAARASAQAPAGPPAAAAAPPRPAPVALPGGRTPAVSAEALTCAANVDRRSAPRMMYQGRMYYFCTEQERVAFAKEPAKYVR
jgi:YHS domain-containing protein